MIQKPTRVRQFETAHQRYLEPVIANFFERQLSSFFGPTVRDNMARELVKLFFENVPERSRLKHGQILWNALDKNTKPGTPATRYQNVVLTVVAKGDLEQLQKGVPLKKVRQLVIARMLKEAFLQGGLLSMRDVGLILCIDDGAASVARMKHEEQTGEILPHVGSIHDMGTTVTHKKQIVYKHIVEKKPTNLVARETNHSQRAVDRYIKDFYRVKILYKERKSLEYIHMATSIAKHVIGQYIDIIELYVKDS